MIVCITGLIGGGKTYCAVENMIAALCRGRHVYSNIHPVPAGCDKHLGRVDWRSGWHTIDCGSDWNTITKGSLLVIDEFSEFFDSGDRARNSDLQSGFVRFLRQSRKLGVDVWLIGQSWEALDARIRRLVGQRWHSRDMAQFRVFGFPLGRWVPYWRNRFRRRELDSKGVQLAVRWIEKKPVTWDCYDTLQVIGDAMLRDALPPVSISPVVSGRGGLWFLLGCCLSVFGFFSPFKSSAPALVDSFFTLPAPPASTLAPPVSSTPVSADSSPEYLPDPFYTPIAGGIRWRVARSSYGDLEVGKICFGLRRIVVQIDDDSALLRSAGTNDLWIYRAPHPL